MRAVSIPDELVWEDAVRRTIAPPGGNMTDPDCGPVDAIIDLPDAGPGSTFDGVPRFSMKIALEDGDLERIQEHGFFWLCMHANGIVPFGFAVPEDA